MADVLLFQNLFHLPKYTGPAFLTSHSDLCIWSGNAVKKKKLWRSTWQAWRQSNDTVCSCFWKLWNHKREIPITASVSLPAFTHIRHILILIAARLRARGPVLDLHEPSSRRVRARAVASRLRWHLLASLSWGRITAKIFFFFRSSHQ